MTKKTAKISLIRTSFTGHRKKILSLYGNERYSKAMNSTNIFIFIFIYFLYLFSGGKSGYGMISRLDNNFIHKEMWID
jgi:hypothetical protein